MDHFCLIRRCDGLRYDFHKAGARGGYPLFRRADADFWIGYDQTWGWCARLPDSDRLAGLSWGQHPQAQPTHGPPAGAWVSRKGDRSYVYDLIHEENHD
jgi:hypothetical protein